MPFKKRQAKTPDEVQILRQFQWVAPVLTTFRERPIPGAYVPRLSPTFDIFGTSRIGEIQFATVTGAVAQIEVLHTKVPADRWRHYHTMTWEHDDAVTQQVLIPGIVVTDTSGFPFVGIEGAVLTTEDRPRAIRNVVVPPLGFLGVQTLSVLGAAARMKIVVLWTEYPVGETASNLT